MEWSKFERRSSGAYKSIDKCLVRVVWRSVFRVGEGESDSFGSAVEKLVDGDCPLLDGGTV